MHFVNLRFTQSQLRCIYSLPKAFTEASFRQPFVQPVHLLGITQDRKTSITMLSKENRETASPTLGR